MRVDRLINVLSEITLIEMMVTIGLGVTFSDVLRVSRNYGRVARAVLANTIFVPATALGVNLVIVTGSFPGTLSIGSATAYALFQTIVIALVALAWGRLTPAGIDSMKMKAA
jgi:hypothetical protein